MIGGVIRVELVTPVVLRCLVSRVVRVGLVCVMVAIAHGIAPSLIGDTSIKMH